MNIATRAASQLTLSTRFLQAPLPVAAALQDAQQLAAAIRKVHESGRVCGTIDPAQVVFSAAGVELGDGERGSECTLTAPEALAGSAPDQRSDIFIFGSIFYKLLTGDAPFPGNFSQPSAPTNFHDGHNLVPADNYPELKRVLMQCIESNPAHRWQRMQMVFMELKLLVTAVHRSVPALPWRRQSHEMREAIQRIERNVEARVSACDLSLTELQRANAETRNAVSALEHSLASIREITTRLEAGLAESTKTTAYVEEALSGQLAAIEEELSKHGVSIQTLHTTMSQTDDLLERVVDSFDGLQSLIIDQAGEKAVPAEV